MSKPKISIQYEAAHLGGHAGKTHVDRGILKFAFEVLGCRSILDIGCGPGGQIIEASNIGFTDCLGLDGDTFLKPTHSDVISKYPVHFNYVDFTLDRIVFTTEKAKFDMAWSCEFLEHVEEQYMSNYMSAFQGCKWVFVTHALPGKTGHHHVNCQEAAYWIGKFKEYGFRYDKVLTEETRKVSTMEREFYRNTGMVFRNENR